MRKLNIAVCVKQTVDKEINPFDACALEEALRIENADVTVLCMGPQSAEEMLLRISRLGVKRCILLTDPVLAGSDTLVTAYALSCAVKSLSPAPELILCGRQSVDGDTAQVGPELSVALGYSLITNVMKLGVSLAKNKLICTTRFGEESAVLPAVATIERINTLRFPKLGSKSVGVEKITAADIGADAKRCGLSASPTKVLKTFESSLGKRKCRFVTLAELDDIMRTEAERERTDAASVPSDGKKLPLVWCVGEKPLEKARTVAEDIRIIDESLSPFDIAELAKEEKPSVILWSSDFLGRRNAPQAAYLLSTGLCADCTKLETDGEKLFMYRPAFSGSIIAKIECRTLPQMATVRSAEETEESIMIGVGVGAAEVVGTLKDFAEAHGFGFGASRAAVDKLALPYEYQIGLTGRNVCPKVYLAVGISGAVQHTCAVDRAGCIIAVNTDRNARIFEYADYGIIADAKELLSSLPM